MILDTSVIVALDRGTDTAKVERLDSASPHQVSAATVTEYYAGVELADGEEQESDAERLLGNAEEVAVDGRIAREAGRIIADLTEAGNIIGMNDVYIAATARVLDEPVLTADTADFERVDGIAVEDWNEF